MATKNSFIGIDIGTSGIRASVIDECATEIICQHLPLPSSPSKNGHCEVDAHLWQKQCWRLLKTLVGQITAHYHICAIAIDGTSSTVIACNAEGKPLGRALMYNDQQSIEAANLIARIAPAECAAHGASSSLAKAITLQQRYPDTAFFLHQADWLLAELSGRYPVSDENNCLKMGYDVVRRCWPEWITHCGIGVTQLPEVFPPGTSVARIRAEHAAFLSLPADCQIVTGSTDSIAAFIATGADNIGEAVTSLGSTLVIKLISDAPIFAPDYGVYSHRLGKHWLVGGASNSGGNVLRHFFTQQQLDTLTDELKPRQPTGLQYYPLIERGERFPVNDANKLPVLSPRPDDNRVFFQAILEGISCIEYQGYKKLEQLGAVKVNRIFTCGGGDNNPAWRKIRELTLGVPVVSARQTQASYGSALLAKQGWQRDVQ